MRADRPTVRAERLGVPSLTTFICLHEVPGDDAAGTEAMPTGQYKREGPILEISSTIMGYVDDDKQGLKAPKEN